MTTLARRDDDELVRGLTAWCAHEWPGAGYGITSFARPNAGWTNETLLVTVRGRDDERRLVVRLPPAVPTWPVYDLAAQARVLEVLATSQLPVPGVLAFVTDPTWLGVGFLVMTHEDGVAGGEAPALEPWVKAAPVTTQQRMHEGFVDTLAALHGLDWRAAGLEAVLRGGDGALANEVAWWVDYIDWASDGSPPVTLADAIGWCARTVSATEPPSSLCWGDARIDNVLFTPAGEVASVLDWEMATIGPAETDLAWYLALDDLTVRFTKQRVPGFLSRADLIRRYEGALGRPVVDLEWHEIFALIRSTAVNDRQARLAAESGVDYPGVAGDANPVLRILTKRIEEFASGR
jgi:aminoglycoside phosphotransferase (APT) family kinase protein